MFEWRWFSECWSLDWRIIIVYIKGIPWVMFLNTLFLLNNLTGSFGSGSVTFSNWMLKWLWSIMTFTSTITSGCISYLRFDYRGYVFVFGNVLIYYFFSRWSHFFNDSLFNNLLRPLFLNRFLKLSYFPFILFNFNVFVLLLIRDIKFVQFS